MGKNCAILVLLASGSVLAGGIYQARCGECGYVQDELWNGSGLEDPFAVYALYWAADWNQVLSVEFDLSHEFGELIDYDFAPIRRSTEIWDVVGEHIEEYREFSDDWEPPGVIAEGDFPSGARIASDRPETHLPPRMLLLEEVWGEGHVFPCPVCGERTLRFLETGLWD